MGFILSKIWGRESTSQQIERIQKEIVSIQDFKRDTKAKQDKITKRLNISFSILYALAIILGLIYAKFYYHNPHKNMDFIFKFKIFLGFGLAPMTFIFLKRGLTWWFSRRLNKNEVKLKELREKKSKILDEVTEKETFKVAREILEKFAPESLSKYGMVSGYGISSRNTSAPSSSSSSYSGRSSYSSYSSDTSGSTSLRHRIVPGSSKSVISSAFSSTPSTSTTSSSSIFSSGAPSTSLTSTSGYSSRSTIQPSRPTIGMRAPSQQPPRPMGPIRPRAPGPRPMMRPMAPQNRMPMGPPLPRPVVPAQKGFLGKIVDYVVGDGPGNRYALICNQCQSHNGMAQEEDYEYTSYRCCYCHYWNPPKKNKPMAPKLVLPPPEPSKKEEKAEETKKDTETSKSTEEPKEKSVSSKEEEEPVPSSSSGDSQRESDVSKDTASKNDESTKLESEDPVLVESLQVSNASVKEEDNVSDTEAQVNKESASKETEGEEENASESKSDSDSDIDIIDEKEALEAMEIDEMSKSNLEKNDNASELKKEE